MSLNNGSGIEYPTIKLGEKVYAIKWSAATEYDMSAAGVSLGGVASPIPGKVNIPFHQVVDALSILIGFEGTKHELAELVTGRTQEAYDKIILARGKVTPSKTAQQETPAADEVLLPLTQ
jgi:hypothetical protein